MHKLLNNFSWSLLLDHLVELLEIHIKYLKAPSHLYHTASRTMGKRLLFLFKQLKLQICTFETTLTLPYSLFLKYSVIVG
jgi:hypothetical protein